MSKTYTKFFTFSVLFFVVFSCGKDDTYIPIATDDEPVEISPVVFDIEQVPYQTLSEYNFFEDEMKDLNPVYGVLPYDLISPLFSDYAHKKRFVWMPPGVSANYVNDYSILDFPIGTILIKNFYYENILPEGNTRILETRLQIKKEDGWVFANYKWNEEQTQAVYDLNGSYVNLSFMENAIEKNVNYVIPSGSHCLTCHKSDNDVAFPIGVKPQNLDKTMSYIDGTMNQLEKWGQMGYLTEGYPTSINTIVNYNDETQPLELRVRSYLDINCAHCHTDNRHCDYRPIRFAFNESADIANLGVCVEADEIFDPAIPYIVNPKNPERSVLAVRIKSVAPDRRMPLLGRTLKHEEGIVLIDSWIRSLNTICE